MPVTFIMTRIIEVATEHADMWDLGYTRLSADNQTWVLSRVSIEMNSYPKAERNYTIHTWVENSNRHFSFRNFEFCDEDGNTLGFARSIWAVIDVTTREIKDISKFECLSEVNSDRECPIATQPRLLAIKDDNAKRHSFQYCDLDINRHVNSVRYVELLMNQLPFSVYEKNMVKRFEVAFIKECVYDRDVKICIDRSAPQDIRLEIIDAEDGSSHCRARILLEPRQTKN